MKFNFDYQFIDENQKPITIGPLKDPATLKQVSVMALLHGPDQGHDMSKKRQRYDIAVKIKNFGPQAELNDSDVTLLKEMIGVSMVPLVVGQSVAILEGNEPPTFV